MKSSSGELERDGYAISTDRALLDLDFVCRELNGTYWAEHRPRVVIQRSIRRSLCFGMYLKSPRQQVGFARVVTDGATFSWICDVVIASEHRRKGLGKWLMACVTAHPGVKNALSILGTRDAHGLYEKFGFVRAEMMRRVPAPIPPGTSIPGKVPRPATETAR